MRKEKALERHEILAAIKFYEMASEKGGLIKVASRIVNKKCYIETEINAAIYAYLAAKVDEKGQIEHLKNLADLYRILGKKEEEKKIRERIDNLMNYNRA